MSKKGKLCYMMYYNLQNEEPNRCRKYQLGT